MGITLLKPDINKSGVDFSIEGDSRRDKSIRLGLSVVKNVGTAAIESILGARRRDGSFESLRAFCTRVDLSKVNKKTFESLIKAGAFDDLGKRAELLTGMSFIIDEVHKDKKHSQNGQMGMFELGGGNPSVHDALPQVEEFTKAELLRFEKALLGFYLTEHPLTPVFSKIAQKITHNIADLSSSDVRAAVVLGGIIATLKKIITKSSGQEMAFVKLSDLTGAIEIVVFPKTYAKVKSLLIPDTIVLIKGRVDEREDRLTMIADDVFSV